LKEDDLKNKFRGEKRKEPLTRNKERFTHRSIAHLSQHSTESAITIIGMDHPELAEWTWGMAAQLNHPGECKRAIA
jgi:hypothetical protein